MKKFLTLIGTIALSQAAGFFGALFTITAIPTWYEMLIRPTFAPPNWVFGPVWTLLYTLMGIALWFVIYAPSKQPKHLAYGAFATQLILNTLWSIVFFGLQQIALALFVIVLLILAIIWMMWSFRKHSKIACNLLVPYLLWVSFATILNASFLLLN